MRLGFRLVLYLLIAAVLGLVGFAMFSDLPAPTSEVSVPVQTE
jgi:hypothetical protein